MSGALSSFTAMAIAGRQLALRGFAPSQIVFFRSLLGFLVLALLMARTPSKLRTRRFGLHALRAAAHFIGQCAWFAGLARMPLATVFALEFTVPVWATLGSWALLGEKPRARSWLALGLGILGVLLIVRPGAALFQPAAWIVLGAALAYALAHVLGRDLARSESPYSIIFYMTLVQLPLAAFVAAGRPLPSFSGGISWLAVVAASALSAHYCLAAALSLVDVATVLALDFLRLPLIACVGFALFGEQLDAFVAAGSLLMLLGNWVGADRGSHR